MAAKVLFRTGTAAAVAASVWVMTEMGKVNGSKKLEINSSELKQFKVPRQTIDDAICKSRLIMQRTKEHLGLPGIVVAVSVNGQIVWQEGFGYSDVENDVPCTPQTVMRIASISKSITMTAVAKLYEQGLLDLDKPVQHYVPQFPEKTFEGKKVQITTRQLVSHLSGIRHYKQDPDKDTFGDSLADQEFCLKDKFESVAKSLELFQNDPLIHKPGDSYLYTTHGFTLVSAVVESVAGEPFTQHITKLFKKLGMNRTYLDVHEPLIPYRSKYYVKHKSGSLMNAPYVDNSYKWAGGGFLSTVGDLVRFGNVMLYSYQYEPEKQSPDNHFLPGYLSRKTVTEMWTGLEKTKQSKNEDILYGMGWVVKKYEPQHGYGRLREFMVGHSGGAVGASSMLVVMPSEDGTVAQLPKGVVVAMFTNMTHVSLFLHALTIARIFNEVTL